MTVLKVIGLLVLFVLAVAFPPFFIGLGCTLVLIALYLLLRGLAQRDR